MSTRPIIKENLSNPYQYSKNIVSDPSKSIDEINIPEVDGLTAEFVYNFYTRDERINPPIQKEVRNIPLNKIARYVFIKWNKPNTQFYIENTDKDLTIQRFSDLIISEDNFFNPGYINHTFSSVDAITQGSSDIENYSRISGHDTESIFRMSRTQIQEISNGANIDNADQEYNARLSSLVDTYSLLSDFPKNSLGLRVYNPATGENIEDDNLLRSITNSISLSMKINSSVISDIFYSSREKSISNNLNVLKTSQASVLSLRNNNNSQHLVPVQNKDAILNRKNLTQNVSLIGYVIDRYLVTQKGFVKQDTFYIEDINKTFFEDTGVKYGLSYVYSVKVVASIKILTYRDSSESIVDISTVFVSSRAISTPVECYEYVPPPEPNDIRFIFNHIERNLTIRWDSPVNPQKDIKQYQVFRRKSIKEPFELIAQYGFDTSDLGPGTGGRYRTGEVVDANNIQQMNADYKVLVKQSEYPVFFHVDKDFTVDPEFFISSEYIYAICAIDAHGMISNYSSQHYVTFDPYKNKLITKLICDQGSPRQYPNMNLRIDAFKDTIKVSGDTARQLKVYFTPEYLKVKDEKRTYKIVEAQTPVNTTLIIFCSLSILTIKKRSY